MPSSSSVSPPEGGRRGAAEEEGGGGRMEEETTTAALGVGVLNWALEIPMGAKSDTETTRTTSQTMGPIFSPAVCRAAPPAGSGPDPASTAASVNKMLNDWR